MRVGWEDKTLSQVCTKITDGSHNPPKGIEYSDYIMLSSKNVNNDHIHYDKPRYLREEDFFKENKRTQVEYGDILLTIVGTIGRVAVVPNEHKRFTLQRSVAVLKIDEGKITSRFLMFSLQNILDFLSSESRGVAQKGIYLKQLREIKIPIPPLQEQKQIVAILDKVFTAIDQAKANIEKNIENAKELFQSKLNEIFSQTGDGWVEKTLGEVCENLDSKRVPITKSKRTEGDIPYYGASGIVDYVADFLFDEDLLLVSEDGANLLARTYPIAFSISGKNWVNNHAHVLKFNNMVSQKFIEFYLNSIKLDDYVSGMAQPKLNQRMLNSILVPFPSIMKQEEVLQVISDLDRNIKSIREQYNQKLESLEELKKSILQKSFAGELYLKTIKI